MQAVWIILPLHEGWGSDSYCVHGHTRLQTSTAQDDLGSGSLQMRPPSKMASLSWLPTTQALDARTLHMQGREVPSIGLTTCQ